MKSFMAEATHRIQHLCGNSFASELGRGLSRAQTWPNSIAFFHLLATAADKEILLDHLVEPPPLLDAVERIESSSADR